MKKAVSLTEVIVGAVILALAFGGVLAAFVGARSYITYSNERIVAVNLGRRVLDDLYDQVSADTWNNATGLLNPGSSPVSQDNYTIGEQKYGPNSYVVTNVPGHDYRQVQVDISYIPKAGSMGSGGGNVGN